MSVKVPIALPDALLSRLSDFLESQMGLHFPLQWNVDGRCNCRDEACGQFVIGYDLDESGVAAAMRTD